MLTPLEINKKEFGKGFRGYREEEVDTFLDQVIIDYEKLYRDNLDLQDKLEQLDGTIQRYKELEDVLKNTLVMAQKNAEELCSNAEKEANLILDEARAKADVVIKEAEMKAEKLTKEADGQVQSTLERYLDIQKQVKVFKVKFRSFLEAELKVLEGESILLEEEMEMLNGDDDDLDLTEGIV